MMDTVLGNLRQDLLRISVIIENTEKRDTSFSCTVYITWTDGLPST